MSALIRVQQSRLPHLAQVLALCDVGAAAGQQVLEWKPYIPVLLRPMALTPPLVMPCAAVSSLSHAEAGLCLSPDRYVGSMFLSDTAKARELCALPLRKPNMSAKLMLHAEVRAATRYVEDLPVSVPDE